MSKNIYLSGKGFWLHRLFEIDEYEGKEFWSMRLYPDPKSMKAYKEADLKHPIKEDEEGQYITFKRNLKKPWKVKSKENPEFDPPEVTDTAGANWDNDDKLLGNGTELTIKLDTYATRKGRFARLDAVRIDKWVEYVNPKDYTNIPPDEDKEVPDEDEDETIRPF